MGPPSKPDKKIQDFWIIPLKCWRQPACSAPPWPTSAAALRPHPYVSPFCPPPDTKPWSTPVPSSPTSTSSRRATRRRSASGSVPQQNLEVPPDRCPSLTEPQCSVQIHHCAVRMWGFVRDEPRRTLFRPTTVMSHLLMHQQSRK